MEGIPHAHPVIFGITEDVQCGFDHGAEQQPVAAARCGPARQLQCGDNIASDPLTQLPGELLRCAHQRMGQKGSIDQRLAFGLEIHVIR
ncbi:hypothetical protein D3C74_452870 [compost metagenome]